MAYTFKINYFANEVQLSYYQDGIMTSEKIEDDAAGVLPPAKEKKNKDDSDSKDDSEKYEKTDYEKEKENKKRSTRRSKQHIYDMARANTWDYFATFTFSSDRYDYGLCKKRLTKWFNNFKQRYCNDFVYLCVPEMHEDGAWHFHALIQSKQLPEYLGSGWHPGRYVIDKYGLGICELEPVKDVNRVSMYITKKSVIASAFSVANDCDFYIRGYDVKAVLINYERKQDCVYKNPERLNTTSYLRNALKATPLIQDVFECIKEAVLHFKALCKMRGVSYTDNYIIKSVLGSAFELTSEFVFYEFNGFIFARYVG